MGASRRPGGRRVLLPAEADLINTVGLTEEEYWHFVALTDAYNGKRKEGYELIPDVKNDPVSLIVSLVVGLALSAVSAALAPKPKAPKQQQQQQQEKETATNVQTENINGRSRFAAQSNFDSVQDLATLGSTIPLIFARKGVRVSSTLLWSQMLSKGISQQLRVVAMFGSGEVEGRPDWAGYAIGDALLENYTNAKIALYFKPDGGRIIEGGPERYLEGKSEIVPNSDAFSLDWFPTNQFEPYFSGTRTPGSQTEFGTYSPMANGTQFKVNYEIVLFPKGISGKTRTDLGQKRAKVYAGWARQMAVVAVDDEGATFRFGYGTSATNRFGVWGEDEAIAAAEQGRHDADESIGVGELYMVGTKLAVAVDVPAEPWRAGTVKEFKFRWLEGRGEVSITRPVDTRKGWQVYCIQRAAVATVSSNRSCDATEIGIKSTVYRQINGFANVNAYPGPYTIEVMQNDNASFTLGTMQVYTPRMSFFRLEVRPLGKNADWQDLNGGKVFCVEGRTPQSQYNYIRIHHPFGQYEFRMVPYPGNQAMKELYGRTVWRLSRGGTTTFKENGFTVEFAGGERHINHYSVNSTHEWMLGGHIGNLNEYVVVSDLVTYQEESSSHLDGPEHKIVYVNEIVEQDAPQYDNLCLAGLRLDSGKEWSSFSKLSAFFKKGVKVERLVTGGRSATNLLPEIAYALLTDPLIGAGTLIGKDQVDRERMKEAALFCQANDFTWDGVIDKSLNLREWIFDQAAFCLLDFTILGGRFSLVPSVPVNSDWSIDFDGKPEIKALFTDGNIKDLKVSFLSPEERQLFRGVATWRKDKMNGFPETQTLTMRLSDAEGGNDADPEESFDLAGFCTSKEHAITFLKYALKLRKVVDHGLSFQTTPQAAMNLSPGEYFRLVSEVTHTSRFNNGTIGPDGTIQCVNTLSNGKHSILYWEPGTEGVKAAVVTVAGGKAQNTNLRNTVFTLNNSTTVNRVYKLESLTYGDDGMVEVSASYAPITSSGSLAVLDWGSDDFILEHS
jgi:hypothetical protein